MNTDSSLFIALYIIVCIHTVYKHEYQHKGIRSLIYESTNSIQQLVQPS